MKRNKTFLLFATTLCLVMALAFFMSPGKGVAGVELREGWISGTIQMGSETLSNANISAEWSSYSANMNTTSETYTLTVNVPENTSPNYDVSADAYYNNEQDYVIFRSKSVPVSADSTSPANFGTANPGYIQGKIMVVDQDNNPMTVSNATIYAYQDSTGAYTDSRTEVGSGGEYRVAVIPNTNIEVGGDASVGGTSISLPNKYVEVPAGQTVNVDWTVTYTQPGKGNIAGTIAMSGTVNEPLNLMFHDVYTYGPFRFQRLYADGTYSLNNLDVGNHYVYAYSYFDNWDDEFTHPFSSFSPSKTAPVSEGETTTLDIISANIAFINGNISLTGTKSLTDASKATLLVEGGVLGTDTYGGRSKDAVNTQTGAYDLIVTEGSWSFGYHYFWFQNTNPTNPDDYLDQVLNRFADYQLSSDIIELDAGETVVRDLSYAIGTATIIFRVKGDGTFSSPRLRGYYCYKRDENNQTRWSYTFNAKNASQQDVEEGSVTFVGMEGTCHIDAFANVDGSEVSFGQIIVDVVPGADIVIDIGAPVLNLEFPEPDHITSTRSITVIGTVTDDVEVASIMVNGIAATLSTNNPDDPNEVSFTAEIEFMDLGPNELVIVATGSSNKTATDTRTVYWDKGPPTLSWTPEDGAISSSLKITLEGTATDDAGIANIIVNSDPVDFESTENTDDPNEVSFSAPIILNEEGGTPVTVIATDISTQSTTQTNMVTYMPNQPPNISEAYADPGCLWSPNHKFVDINIMGVTDPDEDLVMITIDAITSDEPTASDKSSGGAKHAPDASGIGTDTAAVRSERSGKGDGRIYVINFTADDGIAESAGSVTISVPHDQSSEECNAIDNDQNFDATEIN